MLKPRQKRHARVEFNNTCSYTNFAPVWMLEAKQSRLLRFKLACCYSMAAASVKQVNKTTLRFGNCHGITHERRVVKNRHFGSKNYLALFTRCFDLKWKVIQQQRDDCVLVNSSGGDYFAVRRNVAQVG